MSDPRTPGQSDDPEWTFRPDRAPDSNSSSPPYDPKKEPHDTSTRRGGRVAPRVGAVVVAAALIAGLLAVTHVGPFHSSPPAAATPTSPSPPSSTGASTNIRGVWNTLNAYEGVLYQATMHINSENVSTGAFSGTITSPVGVETIRGTVLGTTMMFTINLGTSTQKGTAGVSKTGTKTKIQGTFTNANGQQGTIIATRTST